MGKQGNMLEQRLSAFVEAHPGGWSHPEWMGLLGELSRAGVDTSDPGRIGSALEKARLMAVLERAGVKGLGPRRREALAERFRRLWDLRQASVDEIAALPSMHRGLAEEVHRAVR